MFEWGDIDDEDEHIEINHEASLENLFEIANTLGRQLEKQRRDDRIALNNFLHSLGVRLDARRPLNRTITKGMHAGTNGYGVRTEEP